MVDAAEGVGRGKNGEMNEGGGRGEDAGAVGVEGGEWGERHGMADKFLLEHRGCYRKVNVIS